MELRHCQQSNCVGRECAPITIRVMFVRCKVEASLSRVQLNQLDNCGKEGYVETETTFIKLGD
jgi:hypothetical protein